jgi:D-alanine--poly(phosphoribitol) ligase subunit 2
MENMELHSIEHRIEDFIRTKFSVSLTDPRFGLETDLFEEGYVDSMGFGELLAFLSGEFEVELSDDDLLSYEFATIAGMARIISQYLECRTRQPMMAQRPASTTDR